MESTTLVTVLLGAGVGFVALLSYLFHLMIDSNREIKQSRIVLEKILRHLEQSQPVNLGTQFANRIVDEIAQKHQ